MVEPTVRLHELVIAGTLLLAAGCGGGGSSPTTPEFEPPTPQTCMSQLTGSYTATWGTACPNSSRTETVTVTQNGCTATFTLPGYGSFTVGVDADPPNMQVVIDATCDGGSTTAGRLDAIEPGSLDIVWGGSSACCTHGAGSLTPLP